MSDPIGFQALDPVFSYDLHATALHLLGIDHKRLTNYHDGIQRRLTDVHGRLIEGSCSEFASISADFQPWLLLLPRIQASAPFPPHGFALRISDPIRLIN